MRTSLLVLPDRDEPEEVWFDRVPCRGERVVVDRRVYRVIDVEWDVAGQPGALRPSSARLFVEVIF